MYSDRIDAIGMMGVARTFVYNTQEKSQPLYYQKGAIKERYESYNGNSKSMIDHCFDKLVLF